MPVPFDVYAGRFDDFQGWLHHFGADAVAGYQCNFVSHMPAFRFASRLRNSYTPTKNKDQRRVSSLH
jgi:hypothetical protein